MRVSEMKLGEQMGNVRRGVNVFLSMFLVINR